MTTFISARMTTLIVQCRRHIKSSVGFLAQYFGKAFHYVYLQLNAQGSKSSISNEKKYVGQLFPQPGFPGFVI